MYEGTTDCKGRTEYFEGHVGRALRAVQDSVPASKIGQDVGHVEQVV
jgi:hypothetical protein